MSRHMTLSSRLHDPPSRARRARTLSVESLESLESRTLLNGGALLARLRSGHALIAEVAHMHGSAKATTPTPPATTLTPPATTLTPPATTLTPPATTPTSNPVASWWTSLNLQQRLGLLESLDPLQGLLLLRLASLSPAQFASLQTQLSQLASSSASSAPVSSTSPTTPSTPITFPVGNTDIMGPGIVDQVLGINIPQLPNLPGLNYGAVVTSDYGYGAANTQFTNGFSYTNDHTWSPPTPHYN